MKLKADASSLVEVSVAMVILTLVIGLAMHILLHISRSSSHARELKWQMLAEAHVTKAIEHSSFTDSELKEGDVLVVREVLLYGEANRLFSVEASVLSIEGDTIARHRELVYVAE